MASSMSAERPTLEDVAAYAGVSRSTASRALNEESYVSPRAREAVLAAARDLGYSPNQAARSLVTKRTGAVALILSEPESKVLNDPYFLMVMREAFRALADGGAQMLVMFVDNRDDIPRTTRFLEGGHVDGALVFAPHAGDPLPTALKLLRVPVVFGGRPGTASRGLYTVDYDNVGGAHLAATHLIQRHRRNIVTVCGPQDHPAAQDRLLGWQKALAEHGMPIDDRAESGDFTQTGGEAAMTRLLERHPDLDAVFAASDPMAAGVLQALRAHGLRVPDDVAVVGFDDNPSIVHTLKPPLTSVHQEPAAQVRHMITILQCLIAGDAPTPKRQVLPVSLAIRDST
ncbi:LacI family transcriptional regulator [Solihabitans fulvus]|uniref:LacI family transcriptional regulator n=1 Tax=Solihabitans fulvus TaxID=1892852 RepID=A0A5B2WQB1_9PSEU|nr:LacI family DNA-binding transcriptional regulator [Solihabitans fulvus]KAA2252197.1 LacI family transcriptional regulator [Solihabitans fulvus]